MAKDLQEIYSKDAQIFVTSHSPAVVSRKGDKLAFYRVTQTDSKTQATSLALPLDSTSAGSELYEDIGLLQIHQEIHQKYVEKMEDLDRSVTRISELESELLEHTNPLLLVEGITDVMIISAAWNALSPDTDMPFTVRAADSLANQPELSSGGVGALSKAIESIHPADNRQVIAMFDHDSEGFESFSKLSKNFKPSGTNSWYKKHKNGYASAFTLAVVDSENSYAVQRNLCIEFLFDDDYLDIKDAEEHGLIIDQANARITLGKKQHNVSADSPDSGYVWRPKILQTSN